MIGDVLGRLGGLHRQRFDLGGDHGEALAGFAGARRLDGGVERQQVGLPGDVADQLDHVADLLRAVGEPCDLAVGCARLVGRKPDDVAGVGELAADLADRARQLVGRDRGGLDVGRRFVEGLHRALGALRGLFGGAEQGARGRAHGGGAVADAGQQLFDSGRNEAMAESIAARRCSWSRMAARSCSAWRCSVTSSWVDTQPPSGNGSFLASTMRPSLAWT